MRALSHPLLTFSLIPSVIFGLAATLHADVPTWKLGPKTTVRTATVAEAREALLRSDAYIEHLSPFDRSVRLKIDGVVSEEEFLRHVSGQVLDWSDAQRTKVGEIIERVRQKLEPFELPWPASILLIKTTGEEDASSPYCRGAAIILPEETLDSDSARLERILIHEIFHVLSNQNPGEWRKKLYAIVGFTPCAEIELPPELAERKITNPDAPTIDCVTELTAGDERLHATPLLYATHDRYDQKKGGNLFNYLVFRLLVVESAGGGWQASLVDGKPRLLEIDKTSYHDRIGRNTGYIIHPEEVLADNFVLLVEGKTDVPTPRILDDMRKLLARSVKELILPGESLLVADRPAFALLPAEEKRKKPQPWVMYAPTLQGLPDAHERWMHEQFLAAGVAVAGIDIGEAYGSPKGRELFTALYKELTEKRGFAPKPCLLGRSRGGLWVASWAGANPEKVAGIAGIYPVFDMRTFPGLGNAAPAYGLSPQELEAKLPELNPIERAATLAKAKIPAYLIHGDEDKVVPLAQNSAEFAARYKAAGAQDLVTLFIAQGQGHNYWEGFFRHQPLVDFVIARANAGAAE